ncbi:MAG TPA: HD domain-containing phosphohydrolase, partial [Steroidobacteraceae bacterium]
GLAAALGHKGFWQLEAAAMLSQIGYVSLPVELVEKLYYGKRLTPEERALADGAPYVARTLLGRVPRMEPVMDILAASHDPSKVVPEELQRGADILRLVLAYEAQIALGHSPADAVRSIRAAGTRVDAKLLEGLESLVGASVAAQQVTELQVGKVKPGMIFMDDLHTHVGTLLVPKGFEVTETFLERMRNFGPGILAERIRVMASPSPGN